MCSICSKHISQCYILDEVPLETILDDVLLSVLDIVLTPFWRKSFGDFTSPRHAVALTPSAPLPLYVRVFAGMAVSPKNRRRR